MTKGLYIHIPFCFNICSYCIFKTITTKNENYFKLYTDKLIAEINNIKDDFENIDTIYLGGGTPNALPLKYLNLILESLKEIDPLEYSIELNPELVNIELINLLKQYKINRVSLGIQTFNKKGLNILKRNHTKKDCIKAVKLIRENLTENISIDLISNYPSQSFSSFKTDLKKAISLKIKHISCYDLILENGSQIKYLLDKKVLKTQPEDLSYKLYKYAINYLEKNNFSQYEISSFSKNNYQSIHNLKYWQTESYYGLGLGAASFLENKEIENESHFLTYLKENKKIINKLDQKKLLNRTMLMGLRMIKGINFFAINKKFNLDIFKIYPEINDFIKDSFLIKEGEYLKLTKKGLFLANQVFQIFV